jgi:predicted RecA/RadA family phage recombinase
MTMKNFVQPGVSLTLPAPADVVSGDVVIVGSLIGIASETVLSGADLDIETEGVFTLPKVSALAIAIGDLVYWDAGAKLVTKTSSGNKLLGAAVTAAANPSGTVNVRLNGVAV